MSLSWQREPFEPERYELAGAPRFHLDVGPALASCAHKVECTFTIPYIAHAPLEPRAAVAEWQDGKVTVWTGTQRPFGVKEELMAALRLPADKVRVLVPDTASGYGGKHTGDAAICTSAS
jgi:isoquinoline 1-oxidoreductase